MIENLCDPLQKKFADLWLGALERVWTEDKDFGVMSIYVIFEVMGRGGLVFGSKA